MKKNTGISTVSPAFNRCSSKQKHCILLKYGATCPGVTLYVATGHVQGASAYWFDAVVNAVQTEEPLTLDTGIAGLGRLTLNRERGEANWQRLSALLEGQGCPIEAIRVSDGLRPGRRASPATRPCVPGRRHRARAALTAPRR